MRLSLAPPQYFWPREQTLAWYREALAWPLDIVHLGESVCSKRRELRLADWLALGDEFAARGVEVVLSSLALLEAESELSQLRRLVANGRFKVEANDLSAVQLCRELGVAFVGGPTLNVYNLGTLQMLLADGLMRLVLPVELGRDWLLELRDAAQAEGTALPEFETIAWGRTPLAYSARCFTARAGPGQGRLRLPLHRLPRRPEARYPRGRRVPGHQRHPGAELRMLRPGAAGRRAARSRHRRAAPVPAAGGHARGGAALPRRHRRRRYTTAAGARPGLLACARTDGAGGLMPGATSAASVCLLKALSPNRLHVTEFETDFCPQRTQRRAKACVGVTIAMESARSSICSCFLCVLCVLCGQEKWNGSARQFEARISAPAGATGTLTEHVSSC